MEVNRRQALVIHAPAVVHQVILRGEDHFGPDRLVAPASLKRAGEIDPIEAQHDVGRANEGARVGTRVVAGRRPVQLVGRGKPRAGLGVGEDDGAQCLGEPDPALPLRLAPRGAPDEDQRPLGGDGGGGIGGGPGMAVGAALALRGSGRLPIAVLGDGDFLMGATALWTAVHYRIPLLVVVSNNNSFFNDELHQDRMARQRGRPVANRWIGQRIADPEPDLGMLAKAQGGEGFGPIRRPDELPRALRAAIDCVEAGGVAVVDVRVEPGYAPVNSAAVARGA